MINNDNAERIGRPIIEKVIEAHGKADYQLLTRTLSSRGDKPDFESFQDGVESLKVLGAVTNIEYLGYLKKPNEHMLLWKAQHEKGNEDILWHLFLSDEGKTVGLLFDR